MNLRRNFSGEKMIGLNLAKLFRTLPRRSKRVLVGLTVWFALAVAVPSAQAQVKRIVIDKNAGLPIGGKNKSGDTYTRISGKFYGEVDPADRRNAIINDIDLAPRNARGMVEYVATFSLSMPKDLSKASGVLFYLVPNRGNRPAVPADLFCAATLFYPAVGREILARRWAPSPSPSRLQKTKLARALRVRS